MKCLLIDGNKDVTDAISFFFESENIPCTIVNDGRSGLDTIKSQDHDLVLLDLAMPDFSGYDIIKELQTDDLIKKTKVLIITASSMNEKRLEEMKKMGVLDILRKPITLETLKDTIKKYGNNSN